MGSSGGENYFERHWRLERERKTEAINTAKALEPPSLTDEVIRAAQRSEGLRMTTGRTRASSFMTGGKTLLGG